MAERARRVLLVDDDDASRLSTMWLLEDAGYEVIEATSLLEASARLEGGYALAILDMHLGDGVGTALIEPLRAVDGAIRIVVLSGAAPEPVHPAPDLQVTKGIAPAELLARLDGLLTSAR